ncbi:hypothetical protein HY992_01805 [Candidatus Micrarchaeota archaeon]|nr:hypothetical protein [Candidatus Micrarchaeota archaeon]
MAGILFSSVISAGLQICTEEEKQQNLEKCKSASPPAGFLGGGVCSSICCLPIALIFFIIGAFFWIGGKKNELRDHEITAYKKGFNVSKKTEGI